MEVIFNLVLLQSENITVSLSARVLFDQVFWKKLIRSKSSPSGHQGLLVTALLMFKPDLSVNFKVVVDLKSMFSFQLSRIL